MYVPASEQTPPNPYVAHVEERDISTPSGRTLTPLNPAYMTREVHELGAELYGLRGHITSLNPIRPENAPDPWEAEALRAFERGLTEVSSVEELDGDAYMRLMRPLIIEQSCLQCHTQQGYQVGRMQGGISQAVSMEPLWAIAGQGMLSTSFGYSLFWLLGLGGIGLTTRSLGRCLRERARAEETVQKYREHLKRLVDERTNERRMNNERLCQEVIEKRGVAEAPEGNEERFRAVSESATDAIVTADAAGQIVFWNNAAARMFGYAQDEVLGRPLTILIPERYRDAHQKGLERYVSTGEARVVGKTVELVGARRDGTEFPLEISVGAWGVGEQQYSSGMIRDITERRQAVEALQTERDRTQQYMDVAGVMLVAMDATGRVTLINRRGCKILGYEKETDLLGMNWFETCLPAELTQEVQSVFEQLMAGETEPVERFENRVRARSGEERLIAWHNTILRDTDGQPIGTLSSGEDITEHRRAEETAARAQADYRHLVYHATYGIFRTSIRDKFLMVNPALVEMLGYGSEAELLAVRPSELHEDPEVRERLIERDKYADRIVGSEVQWKRKGGGKITVRLSGRPVHDPKGLPEGFEMIAEDVTEQRTLEAQLRQSQKMEAIGHLTGGIAHDFNNILTVIMSNAELIAGSLPADAGDERADLNELRGAAGRGSVMIKKLLGFGRREKLVHKPVNLGRLVCELTQVLHRLIPESIQIQIAADESAGTVLADPGAMEQILLNLATNARDAMPDGGTLRVECRRVQLDAGYQSTHPWVAPGEYSCIVVSDTGIGMDEKTQQRIFEPFYTTKPAGAGTGLGMAMVYGLMKQHEGFVHVYSEPGQGTAVKLYFHAINEEAESIARGPTHRASLPEGTETILIVEDEQAIRRATKRVLEKHGYTTLLACDGQEAIEIFDTHESDIDLILTDLVMPKLGGRQLYDALRHGGEKIKFILTTGYSVEEVYGSASFDRSVPFLHKPWSLTDLLHCVRDVLDEDAGGRQIGTQAFRIVK